MKNLIKIATVLIVFMCLAFISKPEKFTVIIDAGHGGLDLGATQNGLSEKEIVASIAQKIQVLNKNSNIEILLTRDNDQDLSLQERVDFINAMKPNLVISLHANSNKNTTLKGLEIFVSEKSSDYLTSKKYANQFSISFSNKTPLDVKQIKNANFYILKKSEVPSMLIEFGYLSNEKDKNYIIARENQIAIAQNILDFVSNIKA